MIHYNKLNIQTWSQLVKAGHPLEGFKSIELVNNNSTCGYLFKDQDSKYHFALELNEEAFSKTVFPEVTGMTVKIMRYSINGIEKTVIDGTCEEEEFLGEFTGVLKEILLLIEEESEDVISAVQLIITSWVSFWSSPNKNLLSIDKQIGLIGELLFLKKLISINLSMALNSWKGPLGNNHDFIFPDWTIEVKSTQCNQRKHIINGINQLQDIPNKILALISYQIQRVIGLDGTNLTTEVQSIRKEIYKIDKTMYPKFLDLVFKSGYNFSHSGDYMDYNFEVLKSDLFIVDSKFPKIVSSMIHPKLDHRVSSIWYEIVLENLQGENLDDFEIRTLFY